MTFGAEKYRELKIHWWKNKKKLKPAMKDFNDMAKEEAKEDEAKRMKDPTRLGRKPILPELMSYPTACRIHKKNFKHEPTKRAVNLAVTRRRGDAKALALKLKKVKGKKQPANPTAGHVNCALQRTNLHKPVKNQVIRRDLRESGCVNRVRRIVPTRNRIKLAARKAFKKKMVRQKIKGEKVVFTDEAWITTRDNNGRTQWVLEGKRALPRERGNKFSYKRVMIWAGIWKGGRTELVFIPRSYKDCDGETANFNLTSKTYITRCLARVSRFMDDNPDMHFLQDGAKIHEGKVVKAYFQRKKWSVLQNAPYSPMLNMIEGVWKKLHEMIGESDSPPESLAELKEAAKEAWQSAEMQEYIDTQCVGWDAQIRKPDEDQ